MNAIEKKRAAARAALEFIEPGVNLGIGTGSTVNCLIEILPEVRDRIDRLVSSSRATTELLEAQGFEVHTLNEVGDFDVYIDGADESNKHLQLIKGGGGALTREKIVAASANEFVCIVDETKLVDVLGACPLPVEVVPMARGLAARALVGLGGQPVLRRDFVTDNGNIILDVHGLDLTDPATMEHHINDIVGVVCNGIFAAEAADVVIVASAGGIRTLAR
jgi:ribose 5-phosphate isomerase A